jgi:hypothetical protein
MAETTTAQAPVEQGQPSEEGAVGLLEATFAGEPPPPRKAREQPEEAPQGPEADNASDEPGPDDLPDEAAPQPDDGIEFEIVHNGTQHKLSRAETIKLAQQGFDYTQKTQFVAEQQKQAQEVLQRAAEIEQLVPHVAQELATVRHYEAQLNQYANVDWVRLATDDPLEYPKHRAQYDQLVQGYQAANAQLHQKANYVQQARQHLNAQRLHHEGARLVERIPEWKDQAKYQAGAQELSKYLIGQGADPREVAALSDSLAVSIARKAMLYDKLVSAKADRSKQFRTAPPVVRPGAAVPSDSGRMQFQKLGQAIRKAGRQGNHKSQEDMALAAISKTWQK